jgi:hypothetical protein
MSQKKRPVEQKSLCQHLGKRKAGSVTAFDSQFLRKSEYFSGALPCFSVNFT